MGCYSGISFVGNKKIANIANTYSGVVCLVSKGKTMKRESQVQNLSRPTAVSFTMKLPHTLLDPLLPLW